MCFLKYIHKDLIYKFINPDSDRDKLFKFIKFFNPDSDRDKFIKSSTSSKIPYNIFPN